MSGSVYGRSADGGLVDEEMVERLAEEAERGFDAGQVDAEQVIGRRRSPGRPPLGEAAKSVESVRLDPSMRVEVAEPAVRDGVSVSEVIRKALGEYLQTA